METLAYCHRFHPEVFQEVLVWVVHVVALMEVLEDLRDYSPKAELLHAAVVKFLEAVEAAEQCRVVFGEAEPEDVVMEGFGSVSHFREGEEAEPVVVVEADDEALQEAVRRFEPVHWLPGQSVPPDGEIRLALSCQDCCCVKVPGIQKSPGASACPSDTDPWTAFRVSGWSE